GQQLLDLAPDLFVAEQISFRAGRLTVEGAEAAVDDTYIGVVDVAVHQIGDDGLGMPPPAHDVGGAPQLVVVRLLIEAHALSRAQAVTRRRTLEQCAGGSLCRWHRYVLRSVPASGRQLRPGSEKAEHDGRD